MAKINKKSLIKLIENLVDKLVEAKVERLVEERVQKITPMLVEHEVNRLLREHETTAPSRTPQKTATTGNEIADEVIEEGQVDEQRKQLRERFSSLIGTNVSTDSEGNRTINMNSKNVNRGGGPVHIPDKGPDGQAIDVNNPNVQAVANVLNQDWSKKLKNINEHSKKSGGQIPQGGHPAG